MKDPTKDDAPARKAAHVIGDELGESASAVKTDETINATITIRAKRRAEMLFCASPASPLTKETDLVFYSKRIYILCKKAQVDEAITLLRSMEKNKGLVLETVTYNVLINALCRDGQLELGLLLLGEMQDKGFTPTVIKYTTLFNGFCRPAGMFLRAPQVDAKQGDWNYPSTITCTALISY